MKRKLNWNGYFVVIGLGTAAGISNHNYSLVIGMVLGFILGCILGLFILFG